MELDTQQFGSVNVNGQTADRVVYEARMEGAKMTEATVRFMAGAQEVARTTLEPGELQAALGRENFGRLNMAALTAPLENGRPREVVTGELSGERLTSRSIALPADRTEAVENSIALDTRVAERAAPAAAAPAATYTLYRESASEPTTFTDAKAAAAVFREAMAERPFVILTDSAGERTVARVIDDAQAKGGVALQFPEARARDGGFQDSFVEANRVAAARVAEAARVDAMRERHVEFAQMDRHLASSTESLRVAKLDHADLGQLTLPATRAQAAELISQAADRQTQYARHFEALDAGALSESRAVQRFMTEAQRQAADVGPVPLPSAIDYERAAAYARQVVAEARAQAAVAAPSPHLNDPDAARVESTGQAATQAGPRARVAVPSIDGADQLSGQPASFNRRTEALAAESVSEGGGDTPETDAIRAMRQGRAAPTQATQGSGVAVPPERYTALPEHVLEQFSQVKHKFYFPDQTLAFADHGTRLTAASQNTAVVKALVDIAAERGWDAITVSGTKEFRREAWREAFVREIAVRGYEPSAVEREAATRERDKRAGPNQITADAPERAQPTPATAARESNVAPAARTASATDAAPPATPAPPAREAPNGARAPGVDLAMPTAERAAQQALQAAVAVGAAVAVAQTAGPAVAAAARLAERGSSEPAASAPAQPTTANPSQATAPAAAPAAAAAAPAWTDPTPAERAAAARDNAALEAARLAAIAEVKAPLPIARPSGSAPSVQPVKQSDAEWLAAFEGGPVTPFESSAAPGTKASAATAAAAVATSASKAAEPPEPKPARPEYVTGKIEAAGPAPFRFDENNKDSFYVKLRLPNGAEHVQWGKDLERALLQGESKAQVGDTVTMQRLERRPVVVTELVRDPKTFEVIDGREVTAQRAVWSIERADFIAAREAVATRIAQGASLSPPDVARVPSAVNAAGVMRAFEVATMQALPNDPDARAQLTQGMRVELATRISRGEPIPAVRIVEREPELTRTAPPVITRELPAPPQPQRGHPEPDMAR